MREVRQQRNLLEQKKQMLGVFGTICNSLLTTYYKACVIELLTIKWVKIYEKPIW